MKTILYLTKTFISTITDNILLLLTSIFLLFSTMMFLTHHENLKAMNAFILSIMCFPTVMRFIQGKTYRSEALLFLCVSFIIFSFFNFNFF